MSMSLRKDFFTSKVAKVIYIHPVEFYVNILTFNTNRLWNIRCGGMRWWMLSCR